MFCLTIGYLQLGIGYDNFMIYFYILNLYFISVKIVALLVKIRHLAVQCEYKANFRMHQHDVTCYFIWITSLVVLFLVRCVLEFRCGWVGVVSVLQAEACNTVTTPTQPHRNSNTHRAKNNTTNVVIQQNSRKLLMMDILTSETCWAHKKWNKVASDFKLVFYSSTITMMHGPINIRYLTVVINQYYHPM